MTAGGFTQLSEQELVRGYRIVMARGRFRAPDGTEVERDIVHHPGAVAVLPLHDDGTVTLVRQFRAALDTWLIELPAGIRDVDGEPDEVTAQRELGEEVGLAAGRLERLVEAYNSPGFCDESVAVYLASDLREVPHDRHGVEEASMEVLRVPLAEAQRMVADGRIADAKTIIGIVLTAARLG